MPLHLSFGLLCMEGLLCRKIVVQGKIAVHREGLSQVQVMSGPPVEGSVIIISDEEGQPKMFTPPPTPATLSENEEGQPKVFTLTKKPPTTQIYCKTDVVAHSQTTFQRSSHHCHTAILSMSLQWELCRDVVWL